MAMRTSARLKVAAGALSGVLAATCLWGALFVDHASRDAGMLADAREQGRQEGEIDAAVVLDTPAAPVVPIYTQTDWRWADLPYAGGSVATSGCGLTCAAMAWEYLSGEECTPARLLEMVGESCVQDGLNYMPGFCEWMQAADPSLEYSVQYEDAQRAASELAAGSLVFGSMSGRLVDGGTSYGGHIVLLTEASEDGVTVHDPCADAPVKLSKEQFEAVSWDYFVSIGRKV